MSEEPEGFVQFVAARERALQRTAWLLTGDRGLAEDLVQTALVRAWPRWKRIRRHDDPEVYVRRVMVNTWATWSRRRWRGERATPGGPSLPGHPARTQRRTRFYVVRSVIPNDGSTANREETTVRATATGAVRARLRCPLTAPYAVSWPVAPAGNQEFFLVCQRAAGPQPSAKVLDSRISLFHVTSSGLVTGVLPVRGGKLGGRLVQSIAATPDGSEIAVIVYPGSHPPDLHRTLLAVRIGNGKLIPLRPDPVVVQAMVW